MRLAASWLVGSIFLTDHRTNRLPLYIPKAIETYPETNWDRYQDHSQVVADIQHPLTWITLVQHWFQMTQLHSHLIHKYNISRLLSIKATAIAFELYEIFYFVCISAIYDHSPPLSPIAYLFSPRLGYATPTSL